MVLPNNKMNRFCGTCLVFSILIVSSVNVDAAELAGGAKIEDPVKQGAAPDISSRFLSLGGVISQLFSGFNQGGSGAGLNSPPNSQFYPGVPAQTGNIQQPAGQGNVWSFPGQGNNQNGGYNQQQQWNQPKQNLLNSNNQNFRPVQNQGWQNQNIGQNPNNQLNNPYTNQGFQRPQNTGRLTTVPWYPGQGSVINSGPGNSMPSQNEGTLDDFFTTQATKLGGYYGIRDEQDDLPPKTAILGKQVIVPPTTPSDNIVFNDSGETASQKECVQNCPTTSEYNPVCGTDNVTYFNPGRLICARNCGINVFEARRNDCRGSG